MPAAHVLYRSALRCLRAVSPLLSSGTSKLSRGLRGRKDAHERLAEWGRSSRDPARPTVWVHASSVGEALQARSVLEAVREGVPGIQVAFTFFSPSAEAMTSAYPADVTCYLPWDLPRTMGSVLDALRPSALLFTQKEVWPTLTAQAAARRVPTFLVAGTLPEEAGRLRWPARSVLAPAFASLRTVAAIATEDGERFGRLGVPSDRIVVTGDPGIDSAWNRASGVDPDASHMRLFREEEGPVGREGRVLVAGSTWESDEAVLIPALARVKRTSPDLRLVLAPHEPAGWDFAGLKRRLAEDGWTPTLLGDAEGRGALDGADAVLVERVGVLADLYGVASVAYVGGGFHPHGLHSVLEPAAASVPVLFGPRHENSYSASRLLATGGARMATDEDSLARELQEWLADPEELIGAGRRAAGYIEEHRGAAARTAELVIPHLSEST